MRNTKPKPAKPSHLSVVPPQSFYRVGDTVYLSAPFSLNNSGKDLAAVVETVKLEGARHVLCVRFAHTFEIPVSYLAKEREVRGC